MRDAQKNNEKLQKLPKDDADAAQRYVEKWASGFGSFTEKGLLDFLRNGYLRMNSEFAAEKQTEMKALTAALAVEEEKESRKRYTFEVNVGTTALQGENAAWVYEGYIIVCLEEDSWKIDGFKITKSHEE